MAATDQAGVFHKTVYQAPFGELTLVASDSGLRFLSFAGEAHPKSLVGLGTISDDRHPVLASVVGQLDGYFSGSSTAFDVPLDLQGTDFQKAAWLALAAVPFGSTTSYAAQAASIGRPKATRAIGSANGRNPVAIILPCHRIVGSDGSLTGFGGGLPVKQWLIEHERRVIGGR